jgi:hypothetical protein
MWSARQAEASHLHPTHHQMGDKEAYLIHQAVGLESFDLLVQQGWRMPNLLKAGAHLD